MILNLQIACHAERVTYGASPVDLWHRFHGGNGQRLVVGASVPHLVREAMRRVFPSDGAGLMKKQNDPAAWLG
jgi:hypothetical protein